MSTQDKDAQQIRLRRPTRQDIDRIMEILEMVNYHHIGGSEMPSFPLEDCFVAELDGRIVGVAGCRIIDEHNAKTTLMAVDPACRGHGVGLKLQRARMDHLCSLGLKHLYTNCDDEKVIDWYVRHFGYRATGKRVAKTESFGLPYKTEWTTIVCDLQQEKDSHA